MNAAAQTLTPAQTVTPANLAAQAERLIALGVDHRAAVPAEELRRLARDLEPHATPGALLAVHPTLVGPRLLTSLLSRQGLPGFVVEDMVDLEDFAPIGGVEIPDAPLYLVHDVTRGDDMLNWSPDEALAALTERGRSPLTITEGISWLLHNPDMLEPGRCFMCIGSRKPKQRGGWDARTPAIWIGGGTGRDGRERRDAPKVGWCWAGNRHTWLGFASAGGRSA